MNEQTQSLVGLFLPMILIFGLMYVMLILPQKRREKKTREMLNAVQVGQNIITVGGIMGKVINIKDEELTIESGVEKTKIKIKRWAVKEAEKLIEA
jgi:preprotein translocase subunit YajC